MEDNVKGVVSGFTPTGARISLRGNAIDAVVGAFTVVAVVTDADQLGWWRHDDPSHRKD